jgi:hypothetical protein
VRSAKQDQGDVIFFFLSRYNCLEIHVFQNPFTKSMCLWLRCNSCWDLSIMIKGSDVQKAIDTAISATDVTIAGPMFRHQAPQEICLANTMNLTIVPEGQERAETDCEFAKTEAAV